jgi:hypothetical protein
LKECKGKDRVSVPNFSSVFIYSNEMKIVKVDRRDRRMMFYEPCSSKYANRKEFFDQVYREINDVQLMRNCFQYFLDRDISGFAYQAFPVTKLRIKIQNCSDQIELRWLRYLFTEILTNETFMFSRQELYMYWCEYVESHGVQQKRDLDYVASSMELSMGVEYGTEENVYNFTREFARGKLEDIFGFAIINK